MEDRLEQSYIWVDWSSAQKLFLDCPPMAISVPDGYPVENLLWHLKNLGAAGKPKVISDLETFAMDSKSKMKQHKLRETL